jgi:hypothetical protein
MGVADRRDGFKKYTGPSIAFPIAKKPEPPDRRRGRSRPASDHRREQTDTEVKKPTWFEQ